MTPRRVLFIAEGQLGDLILLTPAVRAVRTSFPGVRISVLLIERRGATAPVFAGPMAPDPESPLAAGSSVDAVYVLRRHLLRSLHGVRRLKAETTVVQELRRPRFDTVICTFPEDRFAVYAFASGAAVRVGQRDQALSWLLTVTPDTRKDRGGVREYYCDLVRAIGAEVRSVDTRYEIPAAARRWADSMLKKGKIRRRDRLVLIHPGATGDYKIWPPDRFAVLADRLSRLRNVRPVLVHGPPDLPVAEMVRHAVRRPLPVLDTGGSLSRLAALMERSRLCITNDSGPRHLAVAVGVPSLAIVRQHHEREWKIYDDTPWCVTLVGTEVCRVCPDGTCHDRIPEGERFGSVCLRHIGVETAFSRAAAMLRRPMHSSPSV